MTRSLLFFLMLAVVSPGCASRRLAGTSLDAVARPAFISRMSPEAGPYSRVFRDDKSYREKLKTLEPKEADRRLEAKLTAAVTSFELSERLRVSTFRKLPQERPWVDTVDPSRVASALESYLVVERPAKAPDYDKLQPLGADSIVEFVIEGYGMHSDKGHAGAYLEGYGRMFRLKDGAEVWRQPFKLDQVADGAEHLDPFKVGKDPSLFREQMVTLLDTVAQQFAEGLSPKDRNPNAPRTVEGSGDDSVNTVGRPQPPPARPRPPALPPGELPDPD